MAAAAGARGPRWGRGWPRGPRAPVPSPRGSGGRRSEEFLCGSASGAARAGGAARNFAGGGGGGELETKAPGPERVNPQRAAAPAPARPPSRAVAGARRCPLAGAPGAGRAAQLESGGPTRPPEPGAWRGGSPSARGAARRCRPSLPPPPPPPRRLQEPEVNSRRPGRDCARLRARAGQARSPEPQPGPARAAGRGADRDPRSRRQHNQVRAGPGREAGPAAAGHSPAGKLRRVAGGGRPGRGRCQRGPGHSEGPGGRLRLRPGPEAAVAAAARGVGSVSGGVSGLFSECACVCVCVWCARVCVFLSGLFKPAANSPVNNDSWGLMQINGLQTARFALLCGRPSGAASAGFLPFCQICRIWRPCPVLKISQAAIFVFLLS